jgi:glycosyltransferase involved in cell wall biosynthesis
MCPFARTTINVKLDENLTVSQYGWKSKLNLINSFFGTKLFGTFFILIRLIFVFPFKIIRYKPTLIRSTDPYYLGLLGLFYSKLLNIPFVVSVHSDYDLGGKLGGNTFKIFGSRLLAKKLEIFIYSKVDLILPIRNYLRNKIIDEVGVNEEKIKVIPHGIDLYKFDQEHFVDIFNKFGINNKLKVIGFVARLSSENYIYDLVPLVFELSKSRSDFIILILGDGNEFDNFSKLIKQKNISQYFKLTGFQDYNTVVNVRKQSDISLSLMGGVSLLEACAGGKPVISYDVEWHYELVKNNETGYLIEEGRVEHLSEKIIHLLENPALCNSLGCNARNLVERENNIKSTVKLKQQIFENYLES